MPEYRQKTVFNAWFQVDIEKAFMKDNPETLALIKKIYVHPY